MDSGGQRADNSWTTPGQPGLPWRPMTRPPPLGEVFAGAVPALRRVLPFERAWLVPADGQGRCSPQLWPAAEQPACIRDAAAELDAGCAQDRELLDAGARSVLAVAL